MSAENARQRRVIVIGVGNMLLRDDGVGIHAIDALRLQPCPEGVDVELIDAGAAPDLAVFMDAGVDRLIIVDAVQAGGKPGAVYRITPDVLEAEADVRSVHDMNLRESLELMRLAGTLPGEVVIVGVEPSQMELGMTLSPAVQAAVPEVVAMVLKEITRL